MLFLRVNRVDISSSDFEFLQIHINQPQIMNILHLP